MLHPTPGWYAGRVFGGRGTGLGSKHLRSEGGARAIPSSKAPLSYKPQWATLPVHLQVALLGDTCAVLGV